MKIHLIGKTPLDIGLIARQLFKCGKGNLACKYILYEGPGYLMNILPFPLRPGSKFNNFCEDIFGQTRFIYTFTMARIEKDSNISSNAML